MSNFEQFCKDTVILVSTFNRPEVTKVSLGNLTKTKHGASLHVVDDASSLRFEDLKNWAPGARITKLTKNLGIEHLRLTKLLEIARAGTHKYIYNTDNDAIHDPQWLCRLYDIHLKNPAPILSLFNSPLHAKRTLFEMEPNVSVRSACPGISFFIPTELILTYADQLEHWAAQEKLPTNWDFLITQLTQQSAAVSNISFVEHYGAGGIHNDNDTDRALNPTGWLKKNEGFFTSLLSIKGTL